MSLEQFKKEVSIIFGFREGDEVSIRLEHMMLVYLPFLLLMDVPSGWTDIFDMLLMIMTALVLSSIFIMMMFVVIIVSQDDDSVLRSEIVVVDNSKLQNNILTLIAFVCWILILLTKGFGLLTLLVTITGVLGMFVTYRCSQLREKYKGVYGVVPTEDTIDEHGAKRQVSKGYKPSSSTSKEDAFISASDDRSKDGKVFEQ